MGMREAHILEQDLPQLNAHARAPSAYSLRCIRLTQHTFIDSHQWTSHNCIPDKTHFKHHKDTSKDMNSSKIQRCKLVSHNICKSKTYSSKVPIIVFQLFEKGW